MEMIFKLPKIKLEISKRRLLLAGGFVFLGFLLGLIIGMLLAAQSEYNYPNIQNTQKASTGCDVAQNIGDINDDGKDEYVIFCGDTINISNYLTEIAFDFTKLDNVSSFYDLFHFDQGLSSAPDDYANWWTTKIVKTFPKTKPQFFAIVSFFEVGAGTKEAFGVYKSYSDGFKRVFKASFEDLPGRGSAVWFSDSSPAFQLTGDLGQLGCGGCRMEWIEFYKWNYAKEQFELENNNHRADFVKLLDGYQKQDEDGCNLSVGDNINEHRDLSLSALFQKYFNVNMYCDNNSGIPKRDVAFFLKTKETIRKIISGENISLKQLYPDEEDCIKSNGVWVKGPFGEGPFCNKVYEDGGKECTDSSQCLSKQCIVRRTNS